MELEFKHIAPYLPYGLNWFCLDKDSREIEELPLVSINLASEELSIGGMDITIDELPYPNGLTIKPILRPLSDLTSEQLEEEMRKRGHSSHIHWTTKESHIRIKNYGREGWLNTIPFAIIQYLFENHYDVFGLIENGLAHKMENI